ncbi:hypothetical protein [Teredinibacter purpureus]|uniref:hypothetical protein n=1 Tax=Teredinibacter purpureus TaxID=2731756 RepID=UPI0013C511A4|nr:hypothetical protein [Teredinibacter purpureus]
MTLLTLVITFIAANGIALTMTTTIIERTREIGILKCHWSIHYSIEKNISNRRTSNRSEIAG